MNQCQYCDRKSDVPDKEVMGHVILEDCFDCEEEILSMASDEELIAGEDISVDDEYDWEDYGSKVQEERVDVHRNQY